MCSQRPKIFDLRALQTIITLIRSIANQIKVASLGEQIPISSNKESDILSAQQEQPLESQPYNLSSNQNQAQNESYFKTSEATSAV